MMRLSWATVAFVGAVATALVAPTTSAIAQQAPEQLRVDIFLKDADLISATRVLTQKAGMQFVFKPSSVPFGKVTLKLDSVTAEEALNYICQCAGASFQRDENGVYIIGLASAEVAQPVAPPKAAVVRTVKRIKVNKADVRNVYDMLLYMTPFNENRGFEDIRKFERNSAPESPLGSNPYAFRPEVATPTVPSYETVNPRASAPLTRSEAGNDISLPSDAAAQLNGGGGGRGGNGGLGGPGGGGGNNGLGGPGGGGANGGGNNNLTAGSGLVPQSIDFISYDPTDNSIVVRGSEEDIAELQRYINLFDVAPKQVEIKVEFITTTDNLDKSIGFDFLYQRGTMIAGTAPGTFARTSDPVFLSYATGNVSTRMRALLQEGRGKVVQAPILRTLNNQPATMRSSVTSWIFINQTTVSNGTVITTSQAQPLSAQTVLTIAPRINEDNTVTVYLTPTISGFVGTTVGPDGTELPNIVSQSINVVARVKNGETIVLGGLTSKNDNTTVSRVPLVSDLPIIGQFFKRTERVKRNSDLLIFVTPRVVEDDESAG